MNIILVCRAGLACMVLLAPVPVTAQSAHLAAAKTGVSEACVNPGNGGMRLVGADDVCLAKETRVRWNVAVPQRPAVSQGVARPPRRLPPVRTAPPHGGGRRPYVWVCTPAHFPNGGSNPRSDVYVFNGSSVTANVAINILDRAGKNLAGAIIPGTASATYPGEVGAATVPLLPAHTRDLDWLMPATSGAPGLDGITNVAFTVRVTSDQPIVVGSNFQFAASMPNQCSLLPK